MDYYLFFTEENKSGHKSKEAWLKDKYPDLYDIIILNTNQDIPFIEKIYLYINNLTERPKCPNCGNQVNFKGTIKRGYNKFCSIACLNSSDYHKEKIKEFNQKNHGVDSHNQRDDIKKRKKMTLQKNYGVDNPMKSFEIKNKQQQQLINCFGVDNPMKIPFLIEKRKNKIFLGNDKNLQRVIEKLSPDYKFIKHINGSFVFLCNECNREFTINSNLINSRLLWDKPICLNCNPKKSYTNLPNIILDDLNVYYELNNRTEIKKEIDIFFKNHNLGVEINGIYWHSEIFKDRRYHINKTKLCEEKGINLLHFFEDEVIQKTEIVKSIIRSNLGISTNKIFARKCNIVELNDNKLIRKFLNDNHIQGFVGSKHKLGLYYENKLVSLMTFGKKRKVLGSDDNNGEYELLRFCNILNTHVIGGASKLLKYFIRNYQPKEIISYANRRYSSGNLYEKLGFQKNGISEPNYFYFKLGENKRYHRFAFRKDVLVRDGFDSTKSEHLIMNERKYFKIYDCGSIKYQLIF